MKKIVKIVAIVVAVVLVAAFVAPMLLRGKIAQIVKREANEMLDARVDFEKLDISLLRHFPRASLDLKGLTVVGAGPFEGDTIVAANRISVVVNPMSLFGDDGFEVTKVILAEPALHAHKLADGKVNWDIAVDGLFLPGDLGHDEDVALVVANVRYGDFERFGRDGRGGQHEAGGQ